MNESDNYRKNLLDFIDNITGAFIEKIAYKIDTSPTFDKSILPFNFKYCFSIKFVTDKGIFLIRTAMTSFAIDTFWIEQVEETESTDLIKPVHSLVRTIKYLTGQNNFAYKITFELEKHDYIIFAAEIYDTEKGNYDYKINDEMILVFEDRQDAEKFESFTNYA